MSIALDIGRNRIRVLESQKRDVITGQFCPSSYMAIRDSASMREVLDHRKCSYGLCQDFLTVIGEDVINLSELLGLPVTSLFPDGITPTDDPPARQLLNSIIETFLPVPEKQGEVCVVAVPSNGTVKNSTEKKGRDEFLLRLIELRGYEPIICTQSKALVISEMARESFTGIGITFGSSIVEASFVSRGVEYVHCSHNKAGDWIDESMSKKLNSHQFDDKGNRFLDTASIKKWKESLDGVSLKTNNKREKLLGNLCHELLDQVVEMIEREISPIILGNHFHSPVSIAVSGNLAKLPGFGKMLKTKIDQANLPIEVSRLKLATDSEYTVARGLLIQSILESDDYQLPDSIAA